MKRESIPTEFLEGYFQGIWTLQRTVDDHLLGISATMGGRAEFAPEGAQQLRYYESGQLQCGLYSGPFERIYFHEFPADQTMRVTFEDGRFFFEALFQGNNASFEHHCGDDIYTGAIVLLNDAAYEMVWQVRGPKKDFLIKSYYKKYCHTFK